MFFFPYHSNIFAAEFLVDGLVVFLGRSARACGRARRSQVEGELVQVHVGRNGANLRPEASNLVCKHAWRWNLYGIVPVVVVVAQGVREVQDCHLRDMRRVLGNVEVSWLDGTLRNRVGYQEEIKLAVDNLGLLNKTSIYVGTLRRVVDEVLPIVSW